jgi:hypothetical protein
VKQQAKIFSTLRGQKEKEKELQQQFLIQI